MLLAFLIAIVFSGCVAQYQKAEMEEEREIAQVLCPAAPIYMAPAPPSLITLALPPCGYSLPRLLTPSRCHHAAVHLVGVVHIPFRPRAVHAHRCSQRRLEQLDMATRQLEMMKLQGGMAVRACARQGKSVALHAIITAHHLLCTCEARCCEQKLAADGRTLCIPCQSWPARHTRHG